MVAAGSLLGRGRRRGGQSRRVALAGAIFARCRCTDAPRDGTLVRGIGAPSSPVVSLTRSEVTGTMASPVSLGSLGRVIETPGGRSAPKPPVGRSSGGKEVHRAYARGPCASRPRTASSAADGTRSGSRRICTHPHSYRHRRDPLPDHPRRHTFVHDQQRRQLGLRVRRHRQKPQRRPRPVCTDRSARASALTGCRPRSWSGLVPLDGTNVRLGVRVA